MQVRTLFAVLLCCLAGCAGQKGPVRVHGKPIAYWAAESKRPDPKARKKAVSALGQVGKADPATIPALVGALADSDGRVRDEAVLALLKIGPDAKEALPALDNLRRDREPTIRDHAGKAIARIRGD
jgi:HEAT repeat protein